jgi:endoglucanase
MDGNFIQAKNGEFKLNNKKITLRGFGVGTWMVLEHFMIRIPGIEKSIRQIFAEVYGKKNAAEFFNNFLNNFIGEKDFIFLKSLGINTLRFAINYRHFEDDQLPGKYKHQGFKHLNRVLKLCRKYGFWGILDMHTTPGGQNPAHHSDNSTGVSLFWEDASLRERIINLWGYIAERYKDETIIAGYDILNEPCFVSDKNAFNDFYEKTINKIREADNNHIIFLEGDNWSKDFSIFKKLGGEQQALSFHLYPGQHVSLWAESKSRKAELERIISGFSKLRENTGLPPGSEKQEGVFLKAIWIKGLNYSKIVSISLKNIMFRGVSGPIKMQKQWGWRIRRTTPDGCPWGKVLDQNGNLRNVEIQP